MSQKEGGDFADFQAKSPIVCLYSLVVGVTLEYNYIVYILVFSTMHIGNVGEPTVTNT